MKMDLMQMCVDANWCYSKLPLVFNIGVVVTLIVGLATLAVKLTPTTKDDEVMGTIKKYWLMLLQKAPTVGTNPQTAALIAKLQKAKATLEEPEEK